LKSRALTQTSCDLRCASPGPVRGGRPVVDLLSMLRWMFAVWVVIASAPWLARAQETSPEVPIRILLSEGAREVRVSGLDVLARDALTQLELTGPDARDVRIGLKDGRMLLGGRSIPSVRIWIESPSGVLQHDGREYRSPLELRLEENRLLLIAHMTLEHYLPGTLAGEMPISWPLEALKAQAVVSRTYAWSLIQRSLRRPYDITPDVRDQVFLGIGYDDPRALMAVKLTRGIVLSKDGEPIEAFFHSTCGGHTELASHVWPSASQQWPTVACTHCRISPAARWTLNLTPEELAKALKEAGFRGEKVDRLEVLRRSPSGRALTLEVVGGDQRIEIEGNNFRRLIGYDRLKSTRFVHRIDEAEVHFEGEGYGHGVGMCQWGARGLALQSTSAEEILSYYYSGTKRMQLVYMPPRPVSLGPEGPATGSALPSDDAAETVPASVMP